MHHADEISRTSFRPDRHAERDNQVRSLRVVTYASFAQQVPLAFTQDHQHEIPRIETGETCLPHNVLNAWFREVVR